MTEYADVRPPVLAAVREICLQLPDAYEEEAWAGTRWRVRQRTFAHVLNVEGGSEPAHTRAVRIEGPTTLATFRSSGEELDMLRSAGHPHLNAGWGRDVVGMALDATTDWDELAERLKPTAAQLVEAGYVTAHWPEPWGLDAERELQLILDDELKRAGVVKPLNPIGIGHSCSARPSPSAGARPRCCGTSSPSGSSACPTTTMSTPVSPGRRAARGCEARVRWPPRGGPTRTATIR